MFELKETHHFLFANPVFLSENNYHLTKKNLCKGLNVLHFFGKNPCLKKETNCRASGI